MNAFELYKLATENVSVEKRGAFDETELTHEMLNEVCDCVLSKEIANKIIAAHNELQKANNENGQFQNNYWHIIEKPLSEIEL